MPMEGIVAYSGVRRECGCGARATCYGRGAGVGEFTYLCERCCNDTPIGHVPTLCVRVVEVGK